MILPIMKNIKNGRKLITRILLFGANGQLGKELNQTLKKIFLLDSYTKTECDVTDYNKVNNILKQDYDVIINASGYTRVDDAENLKDYSNQVNNLAIKNIVDTLKDRNLLLIHYSTDYVFDGSKKSSYIESDKTNPLNSYGQSKLDGEMHIINSNLNYLIFRTSWVYDNYSDNFPNKIISKFNQKKDLNIVNDQIGAPTHVKLIAINTLKCIKYFLRSNDIAQKEISGLYHLTSSDYASWYEFACYLIDTYSSKNNKDMVKITKLRTSEFISSAKRPLNSVLNCDKFEKTFSTKLESWKVYADFFIRSKLLIAKE
jgi:dTDP-4-dehydrorhamnose reductase